MNLSVSDIFIIVIVVVAIAIAILYTVSRKNYKKVIETNKLLQYLLLIRKTLNLLKRI